MTPRNPASVCALLLLSLSIVLHPHQVQGQDETTDAYSPEELAEDFALFWSSLEQAHGGYDRYSSREQLRTLFEGVKKELRTPKTEEEFFALLVPLVGAINDGHTSISPSRRYERRISRAPILIPLRFRFLKGGCFLVENLSPETTLAPGAEILTLNGKPMTAVLAALTPSVSSDAHVETSKLRKLEDPTFFSHLYALLVEEVDAFEVTFRNPKATSVERATLSGLTERGFNRARRGRGAKSPPPAPPIEFAVRDGIGELTVRTFGSGSYSRAGISYPQFLEETFGTLKERGVEDLLIDLRRNGGGSDEFGKLLFAHLTDVPFAYYRWLETRGNDFDFLEHTDRRADQLPGASRLTRNDRGRFDLGGHPNLGTQSPRRPTFAGRVTILIDGESFSATSEFTSIAHFHKRGTFVGEEGGGGYYGNTSGSSLAVTLPNTRLRVRIPLVRYTMAVDGYPADRGLVPDHRVSPTIEDILAGRDTQLEFARALIQGRKTE